MSVITITKENFEEKVLHAPGKILLDFWADWCGPCRMMAPVLEKLDQEGIEGLTIGKVNVDEQYQLAMQYNVTSIPAFKVFQGGEIVAEQVGAVPPAAIKQLLND